MNPHRTAPAAPLPLLAVAVVLVGVLVVALLHTIGPAATIFLAGIVGSFVVVTLTVVRRRPVDLD